MLESATENSCREFFEYYEGSLILYWSEFRVVLFSGWSWLFDITCSNFWDHKQIRFFFNYHNLFHNRNMK